MSSSLPGEAMGYYSNRNAGSASGDIFPIIYISFTVMLINDWEIVSGNEVRTGLESSGRHPRTHASSRGKGPPVPILERRCHPPVGASGL